MKNILIINQSAELYGSDKAILELILNFPADYNPIVVIQENGPFKDLLKEKGIQVIDSPVIKVKRGILTPFFFLKLPFQIFKSFRTIKKQLNGKKIDIVHSNSTSVFIGAFYSFFFRKKHIWHVHEIIEKPKKLVAIYPLIVCFFSNRVIFNSKATAKHFIDKYPKIQKKSVLVYNGQTRNVAFLSENERKEYRIKHFQSDDSNIIIGLIGRISVIKGQILLLEAFSKLNATYSNLKLVLIGSPAPGKEIIIENIWDFIHEKGLLKNVAIIEFQENIWHFYDALDIVTVPSTEKESFGLVATEAMLSFKPVVAANHGGLAEIVVHGNTGLLFEPNNAIALEECLSKLIESKSDCNRYGKNGNKRVKEIFSTEKYVARILGIYISLLK